MKLTYYGQSCFAVQAGGKNLLFDPFITPNELARDINIADIMVDYILLSHGHGDHSVDAAFEVAMWMNKQGVEKYHPMNIGGKWAFEFGTVKCTNAVHSSNMPDESYGGNPMGFIVTTEEKTFYYSGDTALTLDMQLIPRWGKLDFAILPIGDNFTMGIEDAIAAAEMIQCQNIVGVHYDTFGFIKIDHEKAKKAFADAGMKLHLIKIGDSIDL
jgi:L-ascorbate metabolism protein UlaG (beta-lactamase superfamily)